MNYLGGTRWRIASHGFGELDQRPTNLVVGLLGIAVANPVDGRLVRTHRRANGLVGEARTPEAVNGC